MFFSQDKEKKSSQEPDIINDLGNLHIRVFNKLKGKGLGLLESLGLNEDKYLALKAEYLLLVDQVSNEIIRTTKTAIEEIKVGLGE